MRFTPGFHGRSRLDADSARVPPGQYVTNDFPVLSAGPTPDTRLADWTFTVRGALDAPISWGVALARALFRKGADFTAAMAFEIASTNLVIELGLILALLLGWRFTLAEFLGGPVMILGLALLFRLFLSRRLVDNARAQAERGLAGSMEGHAGMDMSLTATGSFGRRLLSGAGFTAIANNFVMEWAAILRDLVIGLLIAGAAGAWIPDTFWQHLFLTDHPLAAAI